MIYRLKSNITYHSNDDGKNVSLAKGTELEDPSPALLKELKEKNLIDIIPEDHDIEDLQPVSVFLSEDDIRKLKTKEKLLNYAEKIGLEGLDKSLKVDEIQNAILDYQGQMALMPGGNLGEEDTPHV